MKFAFSINHSKSFYASGEIVRWSLSGLDVADAPLTIATRITHLDQILYQSETSNFDQEFSFEPPQETPRGYGLEVEVFDTGGALLASALSSFDVLSHWTEMPRYGFLTDFCPNRNNIDETMEDLVAFRINALQFYDWMYRHEQLLPPSETYQDLIGQLNSLSTIERLIDAAHERNIAAMPYVAIYGASIEFLRKHPDWALFKADGESVLFGENFMAIMDPRKDSPWMKHLFQQIKTVLTRTKFDGIHLDQYGDPRIGFDRDGLFFNLAKSIAQSVNEIRQIVDQHRTKEAVVFNSVSNWPIKEISASGVDILYIEVWAPYTCLRDLLDLTLSAQKLGPEKPVVIAAYVNPESSATPLIMDAILFAAGAGHIALGERANYLADPYFPKFRTLSAMQQNQLKNFYNFTVRYQELIGPKTQSGQEKWERAISCSAGVVLPIIRESRYGTAINLVNLTGLEHDRWIDPVSEPDELSSLVLTVRMGAKKPLSVWGASPNNASQALISLPYTSSGDQTQIEVGVLKIWTMILLKWGMDSEND